jgi:hypothetical protein
MLYTMGNRESYETYFATDPKPMKLGIRDDYKGGIVFSSVKEAEGYIQKHNHTTYAVYGLDCTWEDAYWSADDQFFRLTNTVPLVQI